MAMLGNWPLLERLTNDEFLNLLPHLSLEQCFLTQVFVPKKKWINMLDVNLQTLYIKCVVCNRQVRFEDIKNHLILNDHLVTLRANVKQFYHPFYTYGKVDIKLARGEHAPKNVRETALHEVNMQMESFKKECIHAKQFANIVQRRSRGIDEDYLVEATLTKNIENPDDMIVMVSLPFEDIPKLQFSVVSGVWQAAFRYEILTKKTKFHCSICSVYCSGIESLNAHINGYTHRLKQLKVLALCYESSSRVNKNCCIYFGKSFSFSIKEYEKNFDSDSWMKKLPNEIVKKVESLYEYVPKLHTCLEKSLDQSSVNKDFERPINSAAWEKLGHLGVEYVLKIIKSDSDRDQSYECGLCEFVGNDKKMQRHLLMYGHKKKYLDLHYPDTIKKYEGSLGHMCYKEFRAVMGEIVFKVAAEIEKHHSRSLPYTVSLIDYKARRPDLIAQAYALLHASQNRGPSFSNVLSKEDIRNLKNSATELMEKKPYDEIGCIIFTIAPKDKVYLMQMSHDPVVRLREYHAKLNKTRSLSSTRSKSPTPNQANDSTRKSNIFPGISHASVYEQHTRSRSPITAWRRSSTQVLQNVVNQNIWDIYRHEISFAANEIEVSYENYRKNPESHPQYEEEWNNFWQRRKKELEREGYDHHSYNFQPEWVHYFKQRIEVLFGDALQNSKISIRHILGIPLDAEEDCQRSHESLNRHSSSGRRMKDIVMECNPIDGFKGRKRRSSPDFSAPQSKMPFADQIKGQIKKDLNESQSIIPKIRDNHSNVIHVLRLITALEEHLGSLGEKTMDLLSNALQLEKSYAGNNVEFEPKVLTTKNCHLLETAMEKLKGILYAGLLDKKKISGFNKVIQHTANLLKYAEKMGWRHENNVNEHKDFHKSDRPTEFPGQLYVTQNRNERDVFQVPTEKTSDTLMDLVNVPHTNKNKRSKEQFGYSVKEHSNIPDCPPPPRIKETNMFAGLKGYQSHSGLALFDTKLSFGRGQQSQNIRRDVSLESELRQLHGSNIRGDGNLYNNSFKNNNDTRTNINTRTYIRSSMESCINSNIESSPQFRNSQVMPNMGQNNNMYQGREGGNHSNWLHWNNIN